VNDVLALWIVALI